MVPSWPSKGPCAQALPRTARARVSSAPGLRSGSAVSLSYRVFISKKPPKGHKGDVAPVSYSLQPSEHTLDGEAGWQHQAGTQAASQKPGARHSRLGVGGAGLSAMPGAKADLAATSPKHVPGLAGIPEPRTKSAPARSAAPAPGTGVRAWQAGACARRKPTPDPTPMPARPPTTPARTHHCG